MNYSEENKSYNKYKLKNSKGLTVVPLVIIIIILIAAAGVALHLTLGDEGIITKVANDEIEYNKTEVLEQLNVIITEKYLASYNQALTDKKEVSEYYSPEILIDYLKTAEIEDVETEEGNKEKVTGYIEDLKDATNQYFVKMPTLKRSTTYGVGENDGKLKDIFVISYEDNGDEDKTNDYKLIYYPNSGEKEEIGTLEIQPKL